MAKKGSNEYKVGLVMDHFTASEEMVKRMSAKWLKYYKQYRAVYDPKKRKYPYRSKLFIPYSFVSVEGVLAKLMDLLFGVKPIAKILPTGKEDVRTAHNVERFMDWQFYIMRVYPVLEQIVRDALIYGTSFGKLYWDRRSREVKGEGVIKRPDGTLEKETLTSEEILYNNPRLAILQNERVFPDPTESSIDDGLFVAHKEFKTLDYLKYWQKQKVYKNIGDIVALDTEKYEDIELTKKQITGASISAVIEEKKPVEVIEYCTNDHLFTVANRKTLIRDEENNICPGTKPIVCARSIKMSNEFYGYGFMEVLHFLQHELNDVRNQRMDNVNLIINRIIKVGTQAGIPLKYLKSIPGAVWLAKRPDLISFEAPPDVTRSAYLEEEIIKNDMQHAIGDYDYFRGATPQTGRETATTVIRLQEASMNRIGGIAKRIEESFVVPLFQLMFKFNARYLESETAYRVMGEDLEWGNIKREDFDKFYDVMPMGSLRAGIKKEADKQSALQLMQLLLPMAEELRVNKEVFVKDMLEKMGFADAGKYILPEVSPELIDRSPMAMEEEIAGAEGEREMPSPEGKEEMPPGPTATKFPGGVL